MKTPRAFILFAFLQAIIITAYAFGESPAVDKLFPAGLTQVKVGGEIGRRIDVTIANNLLVLDAEKDFLQPFRDKSSKGGYIGFGKLIDSAVRLAAYSGDERVIALKKRIVGETLKTQEQDGYIGIIAPDKRMWELWDIHEMSYMVIGLTSDYRFFGEKASLEAARKLMDYMVRRWSAEQPDTLSVLGGISIHMAATSFELALLSLHELTGDRKYLDYCVKNRKLQDWNVGIVVGRYGLIDGHAYSYMSRCLAQLELYRILREEKLLDKSYDVIDFITRGNGLVITGTCGYQECWHDNQHGFFKLGETCATAYLIRFLDSMMRLEPRSLYGDIMERAVYNSLFAAQSSDGCRIRYYSPFEGEREYFDLDTYCCPCNYRRIIADLPSVIYYRTADGGLLVNLYTESSASVEISKGLTLAVRQTTDYPSNGKVAIGIEPSNNAAFPVVLRIPSWCTKAAVSINGGAEQYDVAGGSFFTIRREWKPGDSIELDMPMGWRIIKGRNAQMSRVAVMRGPVVFTLNPDRNSGIKPEELKLLRLDYTSLSEPVRDDSVRPGGLMCRAKAWNPESYIGEPDRDIMLTEFTDPGGQWTYFLVQNPRDDALEDDELFQP